MGEGRSWYREWLIQRPWGTAHWRSWKGDSVSGLKISVAGQGQMVVHGLEAVFWITQDFRVWASS